MIDELPHVEIEAEGTVATATLVNPGRSNTISVGMWRELEAFAVSVSADPDVRAVVVRGEGDVFCAGEDLTGAADDRADTDNLRVYDDQMELACRAIEAIRQPTVVRLEGPVVGAGVALALSCDIRIAAEDAFFMMPAARLGSACDPRTIARLMRMFGEGMARWMLLTAGRLPVQRAFVMGAVHEVLDDEALDDALERLVARLVDNAPLSLTAAKVAIRAVAGGAEPTMMEEAWRLLDAADTSDDAVEGRAALAQNRQPHFEGR